MVGAPNSKAPNLQIEFLLVPATPPLLWHHRSRLCELSGLSSPSSLFQHHRRRRTASKSPSSLRRCCCHGWSSAALKLPPILFVVNGAPSLVFRGRHTIIKPPIKSCTHRRFSPCPFSSSPSAVAARTSTAVSPSFRRCCFCDISFAVAAFSVAFRRRRHGWSSAACRNITSECHRLEQLCLHSTTIASLRGLLRWLRHYRPLTVDTQPCSQQQGTSVPLSSKINGVLNM